MQEEQTLSVIAKHPEGIKLVDIGSKLGVDWRILIGPVRRLAEEGKIEKIDFDYFPKT